MVSPCLSDKAARLREILLSLKNVAVACSGGVDSSLLLAFAADALGTEKVVAFTALSVLIPRSEKGQAAEIARLLGVSHIAVEFCPLRDEAITANRAERCYHCKRAVFTELSRRAGDHGLRALLHGANVDDRADFRPGQKAADELGVRAPLLEAGLCKEEIRALARERGLPNWDQPAMACLASRIPYGTPLSHEALERIDDAEQMLRERFSFRQVRVRDHMPVARIEVEQGDLARLIEARRQIVSGLTSMGWRYVTVDLTGFRSGSMNEALP
jgi:uncharacterized protein